MNRSIVILSFAIIFSGCVGDQLVTRRFQSVVWNTNPPKELINLDYISLDPTSTPTDTSTEPAILSLSDRGQASYIEALKELETKSDKMLQMLAKPFPNNKSENETKSVVDRTTIKKSIVFSVKKADALEFATGDPITDADRITKIELRLRCGHTWYRLQSWDKFDTEYGTIDLGKVKRESSASFNAELSPTLSGDIIGTGTIGGGTSTKINEELELKARYIAVSGVLTPVEAVLIQKGGIGHDLEGNISVMLSVKLDGSNVNLVEIEQLVNDNGTPKKPKDVKLNMVTTRIPDRHETENGVELKVSADYVFRHVTKGKESIIEGDDVVTLFKGNVSKQDPLILLTKGEYNPLCEYYIIQDAANGEPVHINSDTKRYNLAFASQNEWDELKEWLSGFDKTDFPVTIGNGKNRWTLTYKGRKLKQDDVSKLGAYPKFREKH